MGFKCDSLVAIMVFGGGVSGSNKPTLSIQETLQPGWEDVIVLAFATSYLQK
jgi:hypothetical protein